MSLQEVFASMQEKNIVVSEFDGELVVRAPQGAMDLEDRPFYVFDEWAADQDPEFKHLFYTELLPALKAQGKTVLVISHDDRYFYLADRCIKLEEGRIVAEEKPVTAGKQALIT